MDGQLQLAWQAATKRLWRCGLGDIARLVDDIFFEVERELNELREERDEARKLCDEWCDYVCCGDVTVNYRSISRFPPKQPPWRETCKP
jgi:hypothetical protein